MAPDDGRSRGGRWSQALSDTGADRAGKAGGRGRARRRRVILGSLAGAVVLLGLIQLVPYRVDNSPVQQEPAWDSRRTVELVRAACYGCHSNESEPYFWEKIAPVSWLVTRDVRAARSELNFSECDADPGENDDDPGEMVRDREMPPGRYTLLGLHPDADLSDAERDELAAGLDASLRDWDCQP